MAHTTIGRPPTKGPKGCALIEDPLIVKIAQSHGVKPSQVCIRFLIQKSKKYVAIPMSMNPVNIKYNSQIGFVLDDDEMRQLEGLNFNFNFEMPKKKIEH
ncbi:hypothetical protein TVAG_227390 [Trichomonas vaginalis G3]|uniref:NADP-dependent oxidoreductase domain-containing protein n=1 Tax=Trichomonas vaginalis (strain ATCC PRA-98 / G3) TaxID=412133 RepID=A2G8W6_TRIV3|nr:oxidoreductase protein [Trichomonas vaginalis G3]EAX86401.1 hypothetical protein TVAG_227390 [Trichomonas vaginalis G3]KAI5505382.1 oxidoreductase protein [Trichomonas vaginalis G3]|eukprot:XP_001299331.1 hypothetical protein [Trichomonas vaginalis G3]